MKRFLLLSVMFCIGVLQGFAQIFDYPDDNGVTWNCNASSGYYLSDGTWVNEPNVQITGASGYGDEVVVPDEIEYLGTKYPVLQIGSIFSGNKTLKKVILPKNLKSLNGSAFENCSALTEVVNTAQITNIESYAFSGCSSLKTIDLSSCEKIGWSAFYLCTNLKSIILKKCKIIESSAFNDCKNLQSIGDLSNCTTIETHTFSGCYSLESVDLSKCVTIKDYAFQTCSKLISVGNTTLLTSIGQSTFNGCQNLKTINLSNCTSIDKNAFGSCKKLESVDVSNCKYLGENAFQDCSNLKEVVGLDKFTTIPAFAFSNTAITSLDLPNCESVGNGAFYNCLKLTSISLPICKTINSGTKENEWSSVNGTFENCTQLLKLDLPKCTNIAGYAFRNCKNLTTLNIPVCQTLGVYTFGACNSLNEVSLPATINSIGYRCFDGNTLLTLNSTNIPKLEPKGNNYVMSSDEMSDTLSLGKNVLIIVPEALLSDYQKAEVWKEMKDRIFPMGTKFDWPIDATAQATTSGIQQVIPQDKLRSVVTLKVKGSINSYDIMIMRNKMDNLHYLDLSEVDVVANPYEYYTGYCTQDSVLGPHSFADLNKLLTVKLPNSVKYIRGAFDNCKNLKSVVLPEKLIALGDTIDYGWSWSGEMGAFRNCSMLKEVAMPSCNVIGSNSFSSCSSLEAIALPRNLKRIGSYAFYQSGIKNIILTDSVESIGNGAFQSCYSLKFVQFPPSLKSIDKEAFQSCSNLESISLPGLTYIAESTFDGCSKLQEVKVPSTLERIGDKAFKNCNNLNNVYTYTVLPINIDQNTFTNFKATTLWVPTQSYDNYYWNTQWSQFREIKEFNEPYDFFYLDNVFVLSKRFEGDPNIDIKDNGALKVVGTEKQEANLVTIKSNGGSNNGDGTGGSIIADGNLDAKKLQFEITMNANQWYFLSFPFNIKFADIKAPGKYVIRKYDGEVRANKGYGGWVDLAEDEDSLRQGIGYIFQTATSGVFVLNVEKDQFGNMEAKDIALKVNTHAASNVQNASWNFIGNPQTSYMDVDDLGYDAPITYWNGSTYEAVRPGDDEMTLHPFQAFFVQKPTDVNEIEFKAEDRQTKDEAANKAKAARARRIERGITPSRLLINLSVTDGKNEDKTRIVFNDKKSQAYELDCDAAKFETISDAPQLYSIEAQAGNLAINERPMGSVNLGFTAKKAGDFTISAKRMDQPMLLKDNQTGTTYDLTDGDYQFSSGAGTFNSRFVLVPTRGTTGIADIVNKTGVNIMPTETGLNINGLNGKDVSVYSTNGMLLATRNSDGMLHLMTGVYIVKVDGMSTKVMVK